MRTYSRAVVVGLLAGVVTFAGWTLVPIGLSIGVRLVPFLIRSLLSFHDSYLTSSEVLSVDVTISRWPPLLASLLVGGAGLYLTWPRRHTTVR
jgi:hypothetical protein